jgi:hypothetical protein
MTSAVQSMTKSAAFGAARTAPFTSLASDDVEIADGAAAFAADLARVAPDIQGSPGRRLAAALFVQIAVGSAAVHEIRARGAALYRTIGREALGPTAAAFVHAAMSGFAGHLIFPQRDADPLFQVAHTLKRLDPGGYPAPATFLHNPPLNRRLWGTADAHAPGPTAGLTEPAVARLLASVGFGSGQPARVIDIGCWGTLIDALLRTRPGERLSACFLFSHMPDRIAGFLNTHAVGVPDGVLEAIADSWEALPKARTRPEPCFVGGQTVVPFAGELVASPFLAAWEQAVVVGMVEAATAFKRQGNRIARAGRAVAIGDEVRRLADLVAAARAGGPFVGLLPEHTPTWADGAAWRAAWPHGPVAPLGREGVWP